MSTNLVVINAVFNCDHTLTDRTNTVNMDTASVYQSQNCVKNSFVAIDNCGHVQDPSMIE